MFWKLVPPMADLLKCGTITSMGMRPFIRWTSILNVNNLKMNYTHVFIGSQEDKRFMKNLHDLLPPLDILIDDGGHTMKQQITTFEILFDKVKEDGIYLCEDLHTSYFKYFGGGYKRKNSFLEYSKNFIDKIHAWHTKKHNRR